MAGKEHNQTLGILFLAYLGLQVTGLIVSIAVIVFVFASFPVIPGGDQDFFVFFFAIILASLVFSVILLIPIRVAAFRMLKQRPNARDWGIAASVISLLGVPLGTAIGVYGLWFLFSEEGKAFYLGANDPGILPPPPPHSWQ